MVGKRIELINNFTKKKKKKNSKREKFAEAPKKIAESILKEPEHEFDQSVPKWVQVSEHRFKFIKLKIYRNKNLSISIDNKRYTLNDANDLVNKIAVKKIGKNNAIKA